MGTVAKNINSLKNQVAKYKANGHTIFMVNGCFDLFHAGHLDLLKKAKQFGDVLVVCVNSNLSIKGNKGGNRPFIDQQQRVQIVAAIQYVSWAILFDDPTPAQIIKAIAPDFIVKEAEYKTKPIAEIEAIKASGCQLNFYTRNLDVSTSQIVGLIKAQEV